ncbi:unnamed protein product [Durusdinium trenchii]|uniref:Uncharacterized protein n=1 Tax=Durusdinium trenchii TaxID=1381693 RepID=A0ABP0NF78_9DINO
MENFLETRCDEENFHGTWRDFLTLPENDHGAFVEVKEKKKKKKPFVGGRYGVAIEEAVKAEMRGQHGAVGEVIELLADKTKTNPAGADHLVKAAENTEEKTKKCPESQNRSLLTVFASSWKYECFFPTCLCSLLSVLPFFVLERTSDLSSVLFWLPSFPFG